MRREIIIAAVSLILLASLSGLAGVNAGNPGAYTSGEKSPSEEIPPLPEEWNVRWHRIVIDRNDTYALFMKSSRVGETYFTELRNGAWSRPRYVGGSYPDIYARDGEIFVSSSINHEPWVYYRIAGEWHSQRISDGWSTVTAVNESPEGIMVVWRGNHAVWGSVFRGGKFSAPVLIASELQPVRRIHISARGIEVEEEGLSSWIKRAFVYEDGEWLERSREYLEKDIRQDSPSQSVRAGGTAEWTFMVYLDEDNSLDGNGYNGDVQEMISGFHEEANGLVNLVVYDDGKANGDTRIYLVNSTGAHDISSEAPWLGDEMDSGSPDTLISFVTWAVEKFEAKHYFLDLWDHGGDYSGAMWDDTSGSHMDLSELRYAARTIRERIGRPLDIWGYDACLMDAGADNYQIKQGARIILASEHTEGDDGWDYNAIISNLTSNPYQSPEEFAYNFVVHVDDEHGGSSVPTMVALNVTRWDYYFMPTYNYLAQAIRGRAGSENSNIRSAFSSAASADAGYWSSGKDVADFAKQIAEMVNDSTVRYWASRVVENASYSVINYVDRDTNGRKMIMAETSSRYEVTTLAYIFKETQWDEMLNQVYANGTDDTNAWPVCNITTYDGQGYLWNSTVVIRGSSYDSDGQVQRVEVKVDTGDWTIANGTDNWSFTLDMKSLGNGTHHVFARAYDGDMYSIYGMIRIVALPTVDLPDLTVLGISLDNSTVEEGKAVRINITVGNVGNVASGNFSLAVYVDSVEDSNLLATLNFSSINPGGVGNESAVISTAGMVGSHRIIAIADYEDEVEELNEYNNSAYAWITVLGYQPEITCEENRSGGQPGATVKYDIVVKNAGTFNDTILLNITSTPGWLVNLSAWELNLTPGEDEQVILSVKIPDNASVWSQGVVIITATSAGNSSKVSRENITTVVNPPVLLVVDTGADSSAFMNALNSSGYMYDVWNTVSLGSPPADTLRGYRAVVWNTGDEYSDTLTAYDQDNLREFLLNGGRLYLSSQDLLWDLNDYDSGYVKSEFVRQFLGVYSVSNDVAYRNVSGIPGDPISGEFFRVDLDFPYANYADEIEPVENATGIFRNPSSGNFAAVRYENGSYRTVFTAFPFESFYVGNSTLGGDLMRNILVWLLEEKQGNNSPPGDPTITQIPESAKSWEEIRVEFVADDPDGDMLRYEIDWGDGTRSTSTYFPSGTIANATHHWIHPGTYQVRVRAMDLSGAFSNWSAPREINITSGIVAGFLAPRNASMLFGEVEFRGFALNPSRGAYDEIYDLSYGYAIYEGPQPIGDVNHDGKNELLIGGRDAKLHVYSWENGTLREIANLTDPSGTSDNPAGYAIGDIDGDGNNDIAVAWDYHFSAFTWNGNSFSQLGNVWQGNGTDDSYDCAIGDIDGDGRNEVVIADHPSAGDPEITVLGLVNGEWVQKATWDDPAGDLRTPVVKVQDVDRDGVDEIIATPGREMVVLKWQNGNLKEIFSTGDTGDETYGIAAGDFDSDGRVEIAVGFYSPSIRVYRVGTSKMYEIYNRTWEGEGGVIEAVSSGDVNCDGRDEIVVGTSRVHVLAWNGQSFAEISGFGGNMGVLAVTYVGDVDSDHREEIVAGNVIQDPAGEYHLRVFKYGDDLSSVVASIDDPAFVHPLQVNGTNEWSITYDLSALPDGPHRIYVRISNGTSTRTIWLDFYVNSSIPELNTMAAIALVLAVPLLHRLRRGRYGG